jgi:transcriptional regulator with XRE-family HTH domain
MRFADIGQQLRAYRLESGLRAEEIAARLGVSRAALYRYEKGEVIKLETVRRLAELLNIAPLSLLGMGVDYFSRPVAFFEKLLQIEEEAEQIVFVGGAYCPLLMSAEAEAFIADAWTASAETAGERMLARAANEQTFGQLTGRLRRFQQRRPPITAVLSETSVRSLLASGLASGPFLTPTLQGRSRSVARAELMHLASLMEALPMGIQLGFLDAPDVQTPFELVRVRDRAFVCAAPFAPDAPPALALGVAVVTSAEDAVGSHQRVAELAWTRARKGADAAARLRAIITDDGRRLA